MFILGNFIGAIARILGLVITAYTWIIIIRALISWVNPDPYNPIVQFLYRCTDPVLNIIRRRLSPIGGIDFSPILVILILLFIKLFVVNSLLEFAMRLKG